MINLEEFNVPIMSDEGLTKVIEVYKKLYESGTYYLHSQKYIGNIVALSDSKIPDEYDKNIVDDINLKRQCSIRIIIALLNAIKEDIYNNGIENYINNLKIQGYKPEGILNVETIYKAINYPIDILVKNISEGNTEKLPLFIKQLYINNYLNEEVIGLNNEMPFMIDKFNNDPETIGQGKKRFRLYLNNSVSKSGYEFYCIFVEKLIRKRIPYTNKYNYNVKDNLRNDKSIFYFSTDYLQDVIGILDEIEMQYPDITSKFGTPLSICAQKSYYGISHIGTNGIRKRTYNMHINDVTCMAFFIYFCKQFMLHGEVFHKLTDDEKNIVKKYALGLNNESVVHEITNGMFNQDYSIICTIIKKYSNKFNYGSNLNDYRNILKRVVSIRMYGDLEHLDIPICYNEAFYNVAEPYNKAY